MNHIDPARPDSLALRATAATFGLAARVFAAEPDRSLFAALARLCDAPMLAKMGLSPLDTQLRAMPIEDALTELAAEYCRLFIGPQPTCPPYASARRPNNALGGGATQTVQAFLHRYGLHLHLPAGAPIAANDHAAVALAVLEDLHFAAAGDPAAQLTSTQATAALREFRDTYTDTWLPAFLHDVQADARLGPYRPVACLTQLAFAPNKK